MVLECLAVLLNEKFYKLLWVNKCQVLYLNGVEFVFLDLLNIVEGDFKYLMDNKNDFVRLCVPPQ